MREMCTRAAKVGLVSPGGPFEDQVSHIPSGVCIYAVAAQVLLMARDATRLPPPHIYMTSFMMGNDYKHEHRTQGEQSLFISESQTTFTPHRARRLGARSSL